MILIFGGAYQGKLDYALKRFGYTDADVYRYRENETFEPAGAKIIYDIDKWLLSLIKADADADPETAVLRLIERNSGAVVICSDISCGVVPADPMLRKWREVVGRALSELARASDEVVRLFCGIPMRVS